VTDQIPNVLAARYASPEMVSIWSPRQKVVTERRFWITVLEAQRELGISIPEGVVADYEAVLDDVDLESIRSRERVTRHDVKARIDEFCHLAGHQHIHKGMTSRDLTENVEQLQIRQALTLVRDRCIALLVQFAERARVHEDLVIAGRSHNVPAQPTTLGKRFATAGEELLLAFEHLEHVLAALPLRGLKGPVGTQQDLLDLFSGDEEKVDRLEQIVARSLGFATTSGSVGQVYPRSLDFAVVAALARLASGPANLAKTIRLMAGADLATEGFGEGQVGSSAMPHKMNSRSSERITGLTTILGGHVTMAHGLTGDQWNEGDVSDSVVRRVVLPDAFFAIDGIIETTLTILEEFRPFPAVIQWEMQRQLPFLATTRLLVAAVAAGVGRETAHAAIKRHALAAAEQMRSGSPANDMADRIAADPELPIDPAVLAEIMTTVPPPGRSRSQVDAFVASVRTVVDRYPSAATYRPQPIL